MTEEYEDRILREAEALEDLIAIFARLEDYLGKLRDSHADILDDDLLLYLGTLQVELAYAVGAKTVKFYDEKKLKRFKGLIAQYEEVMENIKATQAGLACKTGVEDEDE